MSRLEELRTQNPIQAEYLEDLIERTRRDARPDLLGAEVAVLAVRGLVSVKHPSGEVTPEWLIVTEELGIPTDGDWELAQATYGPTPRLPGLDPDPARQDHPHAFSPSLIVRADNGSTVCDVCGLTEPAELEGNVKAHQDPIEALSPADRWRWALGAPCLLHTHSCQCVPGVLDVQAILDREKGVEGHGPIIEATRLGDGIVRLTYQCQDHCLGTHHADYGPRVTHWYDECVICGKLERFGSHEGHAFKAFGETVYDWTQPALWAD